MRQVHFHHQRWLAQRSGDKLGKPRNKLPVRVISHFYNVEYTTDITNVKVGPLESNLFNLPKGAHKLRRHSLKWM